MSDGKTTFRIQLGGVLYRRVDVNSEPEGLYGPWSGNIDVLVEATDERDALDAFAAAMSKATGLEFVANRDHRIDFHYLEAGMPTSDRR